MVAFAEEYVSTEAHRAKVGLPAQSPARSQNRAECFFARAPGRAGHGAPAARFNAGENDRCHYNACQGASLAQGDHLDKNWKQKVDGFYSQVVRPVDDGMRNLLTQPDGNPMVNLAGMRRSDDLRNQLLVGSQIAIPYHSGVASGVTLTNFQRSFIEHGAWALFEVLGQYYLPDTQAPPTTPPPIHEPIKDPITDEG